jgi:hypothetical protein
MLVMDEQIKTTNEENAKTDHARDDEKNVRHD